MKKNQKITRSKSLMKTEITISVFSDFSIPTIKINFEIEKALNCFDEVVKKYSRFDPDSQLSKFNQKSGEWQQVSDELFMLIKLSLDLAKDTQGKFDPTIIDMLEIYGYDKNYDFTKLDNPELDKFVEDRILKRPNPCDIEVDEASKNLKLAKGQRIDLGSIGKGYAIDLAFNSLKEAGIKDFIINAGGDLRIYKYEEAINDLVVDLISTVDEAKKIIGQIQLPNGYSLCASGTWARKVKNFNHLIDTKNGKSIEDIQTVFVVAENALLADGIATCLAVGTDYKQLSNYSFSSLVHYTNGKVLISDNFPLIQPIN